mgnify:CR=1 FL=1
MSNNKQLTPVEWLESRITTLIPDDIGSQLMYKNNIKKAKEMEKERELNAYANGQADTLLMFKQKVSRMKDIPTEFNQIISENFWDLT